MWMMEMDCDMGEPHTRSHATRGCWTEHMTGLRLRCCSHVGGCVCSFVCHRRQGLYPITPMNNCRFFPVKEQGKSVSIWPMHTRPIWSIMYKHSFLSSSVVFHLINLRLRQSTKTRHNRNKSEAAHFALNEWFNIVRLIIYIYICILPNFNDGLWIFR